MEKTTLYANIVVKYQAPYPNKWKGIENDLYKAAKEFAERAKEAFGDPDGPIIITPSYNISKPTSKYYKLEIRYPSVLITEDIEEYLSVEEEE